MHSKEFLGLLSKHTGKFSGTGINHEGQKFTGELELKAIVDGKGFELTFLATGENGEVFHKETSMVAPSLEEKLVVWNFNNNTPGLTAHELKSIEKRSDSTVAQFCFGDLDNSSQFREQLDLEVFEAGDVKYTYSWGLPGGEFKERSGVQMSRLVADKSSVGTYSEQVIQEFEATWAYTRQMTTEFIKQLPEDKWDFSHHPKYAPLSKQFRHMVGVYGCYIQAFKTLKMDLSNKKTFYSGPIERDRILNALSNMDEELAQVLQHMKGKDLKDFRIDFFGQSMGFTEFSHVLIQHECAHFGIWSNYAAFGEFETPEMWQRDWEL